MKQRREFLKKILAATAIAPLAASTFREDEPKKDIIKITGTTINECGKSVEVVSYIVAPDLIDYTPCGAIPPNI